MHRIPILGLVAAALLAWAPRAPAQEKAVVVGIGVDLVNAASVAYGHEAPLSIYVPFNLTGFRIEPSVGLFSESIEGGGSSSRVELGVGGFVPLRSVQQFTAMVGGRLQLHALQLHQRADLARDRQADEVLARAGRRDVAEPGRKHVRHRDRPAGRGATTVRYRDRVGPVSPLREAPAMALGDRQVCHGDRVRLGVAAAGVISGSRVRGGKGLSSAGSRGQAAAA
jgi:hypothetical protein